MKYFTNNAGELFAFESDGSQDHLIRDGMTAATDEQVHAIQNPAPTAGDIRAKRDHVLRMTDWLVQRHKDQVDLSHATTLTDEKFADLQAYRQALRDLPDQAGWPAVTITMWQPS